MLTRPIPPSSERALAPDEFHVPSLASVFRGRTDIPMSLLQFEGRFRMVFDADAHAPKVLGVTEQFGYLSDWVHVLSRRQDGVWIFDRFALSYMHMLDVDLTGKPVSDERYRPFNARYDEELARLVAERRPFHAADELLDLQGGWSSHRLWIPLLRDGPDVGHCILFAR